jgi:hypothetical protein
MDPNELAKALDDIDDVNYNDLVLIEDAIRMLRQQQAEIDALRNQLWDLKSEPWGFGRKAQEQ